MISQAMADKYGQRKGIGLIKAFGKLSLSLFNLMLVETRMAGYSLASIFIFSILSFVLIITIWLVALALVATGMSVHGYGVFTILITIGLINIILLLPLGIVIKGACKGLRFKETKDQLHNLKDLFEEPRGLSNEENQS